MAAALGVQTRTGANTGSLPVFEASFTANLTMAGLVDGSFIAGSGFQSLALTVTESGGSSSFTEAFALPSASLQVTFDLSLMSTGGGDGFEGNLVFGAASPVLEPPPWLGGAGAIGLLLWNVFKRGASRALRRI